MAQLKLRRQLDDVWERALLRGNLAALSLLVIGALIVVFIGALVLALTGIDINADGEGFINAAWEVLLRAISPDQLASQNNWSARIVLLFVTLFGLLLFSTLISISNSALSRRFEGIRRGRRPIQMKNHIAILNWNEFGFRILREIAEANESASTPHSVAILCDEDPLDLMTAIQSNLLSHYEHLEHKSKWIRNADKWITIRRGLGHHTLDLLNLASIEHAAGAIVLHDEETDDSQVVRCVLAISAALRSHSAASSELDSLLPVVTFNSSSVLAHSLDFRLTKISQSKHKDQYRHINYIPLSPEDIRVGIETQVARHRGLSSVYQDLLDFGGEELYVIEPPHVFSTFGDAFSSLENSIPIGVIGRDGVDLWPDWSLPTSDLSIVVLSHDRGSSTKKLSSSNKPLVNRQAGRPPSSEQENFLFVGWNESAKQLAHSLQTIVASGSQLKVLLHENEAGPKSLKFGETSIEVHSCDEHDLLDDAQFLDSIHHVVVFADMQVTAQRSDAQVLTDLLACRHYADHIEDTARRFTIVGELRRRSSRYVAGVRLADDLLVSESLMAAAATQLVFEPRIEGVITTLLADSCPVEIISQPLWQLTTETEISWRDLRFDLADKTGEIAIGYRTIIDGDPLVTLNPVSSISLKPSDEIVILSKTISASNF